MHLPSKWPIVPSRWREDVGLRSGESFRCREQRRTKNENTDHELRPSHAITMSITTTEATIAPIKRRVSIMSFELSITEPACVNGGDTHDRKREEEQV
jgi:hypothetical protein